MHKTLRFPLMAALCCAAMACQPEQPYEKPGNEVSAAANETAPGNDANAALAAAGVPTGGVCGGFTDAKCASGQDFCKLDVGVCKTTADPQGKCTTKPDICTKEFVPVCGCDGKTYGNACEADAAGVSIASRGECPKA